MQSALDAIARLSEQGRAAVFVDLPIGWTLPATAAIRALGYIVVPVISRWPMTHAHLPVAAIQHALIAHAPAEPIAENETRGIVFLLDGERAAPGYRLPRKPLANPRVFNNRYDYASSLFPSASFLRADGIERVCWVGTGGIGHDTRLYAERLAAGGYTSMLVDVST